MKALSFLLLFFPLLLQAQAVGPEVTSWIINRNGATGYNGIPSNVQLVQYSQMNVYVSCTCIPGYDIGPWPGNPNQPVNQNFVFRITRTPAPNTGTPTATPNGHIGVWTNGVSIFNAKDARSYNNGGVWYQNAILTEANTFDECLGHPAPNGEYHHHLNPRCLYDSRDSSAHSPIIGYAFDGYPIYGAFGFAKSDGSGGVTRMRSSYRLRSMAERTTRPDGTALQPSQYGPAISTQYPLGYYVEDFEYVEGSGDLDEHNGRFAITPEYPSGTYAYFVTLDESLTPAYPYTLGPTYYGVVPPGNTGPGSGHNTPTELVATYESSGVYERIADEGAIYPNPASSEVVIAAPDDGVEWSVSMHDMLGREIAMASVAAGEAIRLDVESVAEGIYLIELRSAGRSVTTRLVVAR